MVRSNIKQQVREVQPEAEADENLVLDEPSAQAGSGSDQADEDSDEGSSGEDSDESSNEEESEDADSQNSDSLMRPKAMP